MKHYLVTVTPKQVVWAGNYRMGEYTVEIAATTRTEAIKRARRARFDEEGRMAVPATYTARLLADERS